MYSGSEMLQGERVIVEPTLALCKSRLYEQYGSNYTITDYHTKLRGGFLGFGQKAWIEARYVVGGRVDSRAATAADSFQKNQEELLKKSSAGGGSALIKQLAQTDKKIEAIQRTMDAQMEQMAKMTQAQSSDTHPTIRKIEDLLSENEFTFSYINKITSRIRGEFPIGQLDDFQTVQRAVVDWIGEDIQIAPEAPHKLPHVIVVVGPTGVGKTTTIAKISASMILTAKNSGKPRPSIRLVTLDYTRVGAEKQLGTYGEMMALDVDKAEYTEDVKKIFDTYKDSLDALIIDTSGYSPNDYENIAKLRSLLDVPGLHPDVYLAIMASTKARDLTTILQNYEIFDYNSVIVTKCDESSTYGNVISVLAEKRKKISYMTDGQKAARNFERASVMKFLKRLNNFDIDRVHLEDKFPQD